MTDLRVPLPKGAFANRGFTDSRSESTMNLQSEHIDRKDSNLSHRTTIVSAETSSESYSSPSSSAAGSPPCEGTILASTPYGPTNSTVVDSPDTLTRPRDWPGGRKYRCMHPECDRPTFGSEKELKRHEKRHDPNARKWHCGCCQNLGQEFEARTRKDKVRDHIRLKHERPKSDDKRNKGIACPVESCATLFTVASCLGEHLRQVHPSHPQTIPSPITNGKTCECRQRLESKSLQEQLESGTNKHRAASLLESKAKRGKYAAEEPQSSALVPQHFRFPANPVPAIDSLTSMALTEMPTDPWSSLNDAFSNPTNASQDFGFFSMAPQVGIPSWPAAPNQHNGMDQSLPFLDHFDPCLPDIYVPTPPYRLWLKDSKPADFLAIRKTQDFQVIALNLRPSNEYYPGAPNTPITYNPVTEIITLAGCSESKVMRALNDLQRLVKTFPWRRSGKYLMTSQPSTSRAQVLGSPRARSSASSETAKVFPIGPKDHRQLVQLWFKSILPALPQILSERLGGNYSASLGLRGRIEIRAKPCIQIESPCLPALTARKMIEDDIRGICKRGAIEPLSVYFTEGSVRRLNGGEEEDNDSDYAESAVTKQLEFNYGRPYSRPRMGASVGVLYSKQVSASLGGYVLMDGEKYMLTSDHFISESQTPERRDGDIEICDTIISPSRQELNKLENNLKQTKRELVSDLNLSMKETYGNNDVPQEDFSSYSKAEIEMSINGVDQLLYQVTKPPHEYAVGTAKRHSREPRTVDLPSGRLCYAMDWALVQLNSQTTQNAENRHKYQSTEVAKNDHYVEEKDHVYQPGDVCHETCDAESAVTVSYVGYRSKRRSGLTNVPTLVSIDSVETQAWEILQTDGRSTLYPDVAGDCGAWVIRTKGSKLMGQVLFHSQGRVLFIPINEIFADLKEKLGVDVSLPYSPPDQGQIPSAPLALPLCSEPGTPPVQSYGFLKPPLTTLKAPLETSPFETAIPDTRTVELSMNVTDPSDAEIAGGQGSSNPSCDSPSSLPSLTDSPQSSATAPEDPTSPPPLSFGDADILTGRADNEYLSSKSVPTTVDEPTMSEISELSLDKQAQPVTLGTYPFHFSDQSLPQMISSILGRPLIEKVGFLPRVIDVTDTETPQRSCKHGSAPMPTLEDNRTRSYPPGLKDCTVNA